MLFLLINETKKELREEDYRILSGIMNDFYNNIPPGIRLVGDYVTLDKKKNFAIIESDSMEKIEELKSPFERYVNIEVIPVEPTEYFSKMNK